MDPFLAWLESTAFSIWMRESTSMFAFPGILVVHTVGMGFAAGINVALDLSILGTGALMRVSGMRRFLPVMWIGFWLNAASGIALLMGYPTKALTNPVFYLKLALIAAGLGLLKAIGRQVFRDSIAADEGAHRTVKILAVASLACWAGAITAGRLLAYTHTRMLQGF